MAKNKKSPNKGTVYYEPDRDKWRAEIVDEHGRRHAKRFDTEVDARLWLAKMSKDIYDGCLALEPTVTVGERVVYYLETIAKPKVSPKTYKDYILYSNFLKGLSHIKVTDLTRHDVQTHFNGLTVGLTTQNQAMRILRATLDVCIADNIVTGNVAKIVTLAQPKKAPMDVFSSSEGNTILNNVGRCYYGLIFEIGMLTGARLSELLGLQRNALHFESGVYYIDIHHACVMNDAGKPELHAYTKRDSSFRSITISKSLYDKIQDYINNTNHTGEFAECIFLSSNNTLLYERNVERGWELYLRRIGVRYRCFHNVRHTHATQLLGAGVPLHEVSKRLGHSSPAFTANRYGHAIRGADRQLPAFLEEIFKINQ